MVGFRKQFLRLILNNQVIYLVNYQTRFMFVKKDPKWVLYTLLQRCALVYLQKLEGSTRCFMNIFYYNLSRLERAALQMNLSMNKTRNGTKITRNGKKITVVQMNLSMNKTRNGTKITVNGINNQELKFMVMLMMSLQKINNP